MAYTTIDKPTDYFNTVTWSGDDTSPRNITGVGFQPDWIWGKARSRIGNHWLIDSVRGSTGSLYRVLNADDTATEQTTNNDGTTAYGIVTTIGSDGFTIADGNQGDLNVNNTGDTYVSWNWLAGGSASSNTDGSITSSVSANTTAGFSIVSYTGNSTGSATFGHGLGSTPKIVIIKCRSLGTESWQFWFNNTSRLNLNSTVASLTTHPISTNSTLVTTPSSSNDSWNTSGQTYIAYCFAEKKGYSKFGSYTGNGNADGTFVYTGFKPAFLIQKRTDASDIWRMFDNKRLGYNVDNNAVAPNSSGAEGTGDFVDLLSNGFKFRSIDNDVNGSGNSYIYMSFAENPFVTSTGIPACAR